MRPCLPILLFVCATAACGCRRDVPLTGDAIVARAQPGVFKILVYADAKVTYPTTISPIWTAQSAEAVKQARLSDPRCFFPKHKKAIDWLLQSALDSTCPKLVSTLEAEYERDIRDGVLGADEVKSTHFWTKLSISPGKYLRVGDELGPRSFFRETTPYQGEITEGTGFAVSSEGILVTNAHVIAPSLEDSAVRAGVLLQSGIVDRFASELSTTYGFGPVPDDRDLRMRVGSGLLNLLIPHTTVEGKITGVSVASAPTEAAPLLREVDAVPVKVGTPYPDSLEDIAVLKVNAFKDHVIVLPLGDSNEVRNPIHAMGFPGIVQAIQVERGPGDVIKHDGEIHPATIVIRGKKELCFHSTAATYHGDSGGPIVDATGKVVAINWIGNPQEPGSGSIVPGENFAIPINVVKQYLNQAHVNPDLGPITAHWFAGQDAFAQRKYYTARHEFKQVAASDLHPDVKKAVEECDRRIKAGEDRSSLFAKFFY